MRLYMRDEGENSKIRALRSRGENSIAYEVWETERRIGWAKHSHELRPQYMNMLFSTPLSNNPISISLSCCTAQLVLLKGSVELRDDKKYPEVAELVTITVLI